MGIETISCSPEPIQSPSGETVALRFEVNPLLTENLGERWQVNVEDLVRNQGRPTLHTADDPTCREENPNDSFFMVKLNGEDFLTRFPGFWDLYSGPFRDLMRQALPSTATPLTTYTQETPGDTLEVLSQLAPPPDAMHRGQRHYRLDAHVDQRYSAILCIKAPKAMGSGRLVVAGSPDCVGTSEISRDATFINHREGTLLCFPKGTLLPHYTEPIQEGDQRIVLSINYPLQTETPEDRQAIARHNEGVVIDEF